MSSRTFSRPSLLPGRVFRVHGHINAFSNEIGRKWLEATKGCPQQWQTGNNRQCSFLTISRAREKKEQCYLPMVGIVVTISPSFNLYRIVVLPAASRPTMRMRISFLANRRERSLVKVSPILVAPYEPPFHSQLPTSDEHKRTKTRTKKHKTRRKTTIYKRKRSRPGKQIWSSQDKRENENHHSRELQTSPDFSAEVTDLNIIAISGSGFPTAEQSGNRKPISALTKPEKATLQRMQTESTRELM